MLKHIILFILLVLFSVPAASFAEMALIPQSGSGQVLCYDAAGAETPCAGTGQDGDQQLGTPWPIPRFTDNNNGTLTDNLTGLIWLKNAGCLGSRDWTSAVTTANSLASGACGLTDGSVAGDWRLPNKKELESIINRRQANPADWLNMAGFLNVVSNYWSSSSYSYNSTSAWYCILNQGQTSAQNKGNYNSVWAVRGGQ